MAIFLWSVRSLGRKRSDRIEKVREVEGAWVSQYLSSGEGGKILMLLVKYVGEGELVGGSVVMKSVGEWWVKRFL